MSRHADSMTHAVDVARGNARASAEALALDARRAAIALELDAPELASLVDTDQSTAVAIRSGAARIAPGSDLAQRLLVVVRLHRALGDVYGSLEQVHEWLERDDADLGGAPRDLIRSADGLRRVLDNVERRCKDCLW